MRGHFSFFDSAITASFRSARESLRLLPMENTPYGVQLEFLEFEQLTDDTSKLNLRKAKNWQDEMGKMRMIILDCQPTEEFQWGKPCYMFQKSNTVIIQGFKEYCALMFCKGALLMTPMVF
jgi:hypothetical protein